MCVCTYTAAADGDRFSSLFSYRGGVSTFRVVYCHGNDLREAVARTTRTNDDRESGEREKIHNAVGRFLSFLEMYIGANK